MITKQQLRTAMPYAKSADIDLYYIPITITLDRYNINTKLRIAHFLAQVAHESSSLRCMEENASGKAYEGRIDLGNIYPGDGVKFKGRGALQTTGRTNYELVSKELDYDFIEHPTHLTRPNAAFMSSGFYWKRNRLNELADGGQLLALSIRINGRNKSTGLPNGWIERRLCYEIASKAIIV